VTTPLYQAKAELFKTLGHPARIRLLELLSEGERSVSELLPDVGLESSHLSQQLGVLRRAGLVTTRKQGTAVYYALAAEDVAALLAVARKILTGVLASQAEILQDLRAAAPEPRRSPSKAPGAPRSRGARA
jgi:DNA-binding transcriptional ArsR family regulator